MPHERITYRFPHEMLVRYDERVPRRGNEIRSPSCKELFVVGSVERDEVGGYVVQAVTPSTWLQQSRLQATHSRRWSQEMAEHARAMRERMRALRKVLDEKEEAG